MVDDCSTESVVEGQARRKARKRHARLLATFVRGRCRRVYRLDSRRSVHPLTGSLLLFVLAATPLTSLGLPVEIPITADENDGVEIDRVTWDAAASPLILGRPAEGTVREVALRYFIPQLAAGDSALFARLRFCSRGGALTDSLVFEIAGSLEPDARPIAQDHRPSQLPLTGTRVTTVLRTPWDAGSGNTLFYYSGDLAPILNEILAVPGWGADSSAIVLCLRDSSMVSPGNFVSFAGFAPGAWTATLELCRSLDEAFDCHVRLGRPTDSSILLRFLPLVDMEVCAEFTTGGSWQETEREIAAAGRSHDLLISGLSPGAACSCRLRYRRAGREDEFRVGTEHAFRTQALPGSTFTFTTTSDEHTWSCYEYSPIPQPCDLLYQRTLANVAQDNPDFHLSLGDFAMSAFGRTLSDERDRYRFQRRRLDTGLPSTPFYLILGNHEGELGWDRVQGDSIPTLAEQARLEMIPNPPPDAFYDGCADSAASGAQLRQSYYAWEWGDALFVVLDPFWYTTVRPHHNPDGEGGGWNWTLGQEQYDWLHGVLHGSGRRWKIILLHHLLGGVDYGDDSYGRGGIEVAQWEVAHRPTFEWGGEDEDGQDVFTSRRPGGTHGPIHDLRREAGVNLVIHGHDHFCAFQEHDGIAYVLCPQAGDELYTYGTLPFGGYLYGTLLRNSGHLRFHVGPDALAVDYVRAYLDGDGPNGEVAHTFTVPGSTGVRGIGGIVPVALSVVPNPVTGSSVLLRRLGHGSSPLDRDEYRIFDAAGRQRAVLRSAPGKPVRWDLRDPDGRPVPPGTYWCRVPATSGSLAARFLVVR